jgi:hypothetical protein
MIVENEGPREMFRRKLERKLEAWPHELGDRLHVHTLNWAAARLDNPEQLHRLNRACDDLGIELVIADPLDSFGMEGEGAPSETRKMMALFKAAGLGTSRAWLVLHHPRKANDVEAVDSASGAWGGRPDLMLLLEKLGGNRARLSFPKARWAGREREPFILEFAPETESFAFICEGPEERDLAAEVEQFLELHPLRTVKEIAAKPDAGIGANEAAVRELLRDNPERFDSITGGAAKAAGRQPSAVLWKVIQGSRSPGSPGAFPEEGVR